MLWLEKYKPKSLNDYKYHKEIVNILKSYTLENIPHLLVHGGSGHGKKTLIYNLINNLYNKTVLSKLKVTKVKSGSKEIDISYIESEEYIEITPSDYGYQDKNVIQGLIKSLAQTKPIMNMIRREIVHPLRFVIINDSDELSKDAQAALRRTVEKYSCNFRVILVCEELNTIIEPLRSRCLSLRIPGFTDEELKENVMNILKSEKGTIPEEDIKDIIDVCNGNMRKVLCLSENFISFYTEDENKRTKKIKLKEKPFLFLEYERIINGIVTSILRHQEASTVISIRKEFYTLLNGCVPARIILKEIVKRLLKISNSYNEIKKIVEFGCLYDERLKKGSKEIIHLEAFVVSVMSIYQ